MVKEALNDAPPYMFASLRFGLAFFVGLVYLNKNIKNINHLEMVGGLVCGLCLFAGYAFQNYGLMQTTPSKSAFITSVSVILVPVILSIFRIKKVDFKIWISVSLATVGLYILLNPSGGEVNIGDILTFGCALSFALHVIAQDYYLTKGSSISRLFLSQVWAQTILNANQTALLLSLEPVFAALFSVTFAGEILGIYGWIGGMIVVLGVISSEFSFTKK